MVHVYVDIQRAFSGPRLPAAREAEERQHGVVDEAEASGGAAAPVVAAAVEVDGRAAAAGG